MKNKGNAGELTYEKDEEDEEDEEEYYYDYSTEEEVYSDGGEVEVEGAKQSSWFLICKVAHITFTWCYWLFMM